MNLKALSLISLLSITQPAIAEERKAFVDLERIENLLNQLEAEVLQRSSRVLQQCGFTLTAGRRARSGDSHRVFDLVFNCKLPVDTQVSIAVAETLKDVFINSSAIPMLQSFDNDLGGETCFRVNLKHSANPTNYQSSKKFQLLDCVEDIESSRARIRL